MELSPVQRKFILHWGEMGSRWGINRSVAQVHALLYISPEPLHAEAIANTLGIARSNVSMSLKDLDGWGLLRIVQYMGDRRDHYDTLDDVWRMFEIILDERKKREVDPTLRLLKECLDELEASGLPDPHTKKRLRSLHDFFKKMTTWYQHLRAMPLGVVKKMIGLGSRLQTLISRN